MAVAGETTLFVLASLVIDRLRPAIPHLDGAPPTSSFPSGHTAATVALGAGSPSAWRARIRGHPLRVLSWVLAVVLPAFVLVSRLYRGMHWPTDVAASVVFTLLWLLLLRAVLLPPDRRGPAAGAAQAVTSISTLPTAPSCTAWCASAVSRQREDVQRQAGLARRPGPRRRATAAFTSSTASALARAGSV